MDVDGVESVEGYPPFQLTRGTGASQVSLGVSAIKKLVFYGCCNVSKFHHITGRILCVINADLFCFTLLKFVICETVFLPARRYGVPCYPWLCDCLSVCLSTSRYCIETDKRIQLDIVIEVSLGLYTVLLRIFGYLQKEGYAAFWNFPPNSGLGKISRRPVDRRSLLSTPTTVACLSHRVQ